MAEPKFNAGDFVVCTDAEMASGFLTEGSFYTVLYVSRNTGRVRVHDDTGYRRFYEPGRFSGVRQQIISGRRADVIIADDLYPQPTKLKPAAVTVDATVVMKALTKMLKEQYGIDAEVKSVRPRPGRDLELILK